MTSKSETSSAVVGDMTKPILISISALASQNTL